MSEDNLAEPSSKLKRKYVNRYRDRHGRMRYYFRRGRRPQIPLPDLESPGFFEAYQNALGEVPQWHKPPRTPGRRKKLNPRQGVYLLIHKGKLIYIGSSKDAVARVAKHEQNGRPFDQVFYIRTTDGEREPLEKLLIKSLRPKQNRAGKPRAEAKS